MDEVTNFNKERIDRMSLSELITEMELGAERINRYVIENYFSFLDNYISGIGLFTALAKEKRAKVLRDHLLAIGFFTQEAAEYNERVLVTIVKHDLVRYNGLLYSYVSRQHPGHPALKEYRNLQ